MLERDDVVAAGGRIAPFVRRTPVMEVEGAALGLAETATLKLELLQRTGSFKARGAFNALLAQPDPDRPAIAASGGNFGLAVACAASVLGRRATIVVAEATAPAKLERIRALGVDVEIGGPIYADAQAVAEARAAESGALLLHPYDQPDVVAGQGTCGLELLAQRPDLDTVLVAVGGGGLLAGVAAACAGAVLVVAVETERTPTLARALAAGHPVDVEVGGVAVDSLGATRIGELGFHAARPPSPRSSPARTARHRASASRRSSAAAISRVRASHERPAMRRQSAQTRVEPSATCPWRSSGVQLWSASLRTENESVGDQ